jgi:hypothetical protein
MSDRRSRSTVSVMTSETWTSRDLPVLRAIVDHYEETGESNIRPWDLQQRTGFDEETVQKALRTLNRQPYFEDAEEIGGGDIWAVGPPTADALRVVGQWPSPETLLSRLIDELQRASMDDEIPPEERTKLARTAAFLKTTGWKIAIGALGGAGGNLLT